MPVTTPAFQTTIYFTAVVNKVPYPGQTVISGETSDEYNERMGEFFNTLDAKFDEQGEPAFVTFEPRVVGASAAPVGPGKPLPAAPANVPECPIHKVPLRAKVNRTTGATFYSCGERNAAGGYCNWKPAEQPK